MYFAASNVLQLIKFDTALISNKELNPKVKNENILLKLGSLF